MERGEIFTMCCVFICISIVLAVVYFVAKSMQTPEDKHIASYMDPNTGYLKPHEHKDHEKVGVKEDEHEDEHEEEEHHDDDDDDEDHV